MGVAEIKEGLLTRDNYMNGHNYDSVANYCTAIAIEILSYLI